MSKTDKVIAINDLLGLNSKPKSPQIPSQIESEVVKTPNTELYNSKLTLSQLIKSDADVHIYQQLDIDTVSQYEGMPALELSKLYKMTPDPIQEYYNSIKSMLKITTDEKLRTYLIIRLEILFNYDEKMLELIMNKETKQIIMDDYNLLLSIYKMNYDTIQNQILSKLFAFFYKYGNFDDEILTEYCNQLFDKLRITSFTSNNSSYHNYISALMIYVSSSNNRKYMNLKNYIPLLCNLLANHNFNNIQCIYEIVTILWCLSYCEESVLIFEGLSEEEIKNKHGYINNLCEMLQSYSNEKLVRIVLMLLNNIVNVRKVVDLLIEYKILRILRVMEAKKYKDEDIQQYLSSLHEQINTNYKQLTSFELYEQEVHTGILKWGPCHTSEFFKDEIRSFEANNFEIIKELIEILNHASDNTLTELNNKVYDETKRAQTRESIAVACFDLGEFACFYPNGRNILKQWNGKSKMMALISHPDTVISRNALIACSKLMLNHWEYVNFNKNNN